MSPVSLRPEWAEYPTPRFCLTAGLVLGSLCLAFLGLVVDFRQPDDENLTLSQPQTATDLIGLAASEMTLLFGEPTRMRREPPAHIWQYSRDECVMDVYVYNDTVKYAESRNRQGEIVAGCFETLKKAP